jgi:5-methyltetrahydrofolate--homocysteine methyltransferase
MDICAAAMDRWQGQVLVSMPDLGGTLDILSTFRSAEGLLLDLIDHPEEVKRLIWELHQAWFAWFDAINGVLQPVNPGYSSWCAIFSSLPYYMLQSDFSYMLGNRMFDEFVKPELEASCNRLERSFYHLDGKGQLRHVDSLLSIGRLGGIQWIPGASTPDNECWPELYERIFSAGKKTQLAQIRHDPAVLQDLLGRVGTGPGTQRRLIYGRLSETDEMRRLLETLGVDL